MRRVRINSTFLLADLGDGYRCSTYVSRRTRGFAIHICYSMARLASAKGVGDGCIFCSNPLRLSLAKLEICFDKIEIFARPKLYIRIRLLSL